MHAMTRRLAAVAAVLALATLAPRVRAGDPAPAPRATATLTIDGMTWPSGWPPKVKAALSGPKGVQKVEVNFEKKTASVEYEPDKTTLKDVMGALMRTNKYTAKLDAPVATTWSDDVAEFSVMADKPTYAPDSDGMLSIKLGFKGDAKGDPKMKVEAPKGITLKPEGGDMKFHVEKDAAEGEVSLVVHVEYAGKSGPMKVDLPGVVLIAK